MKSRRDWFLCCAVAIAMTLVGGLDTSDAGPLRRVGRGVVVVGRGVVKGGRAVGRFAWRRATLQGIRGRAGGAGGCESGACGSGFASGGCANGACSQ